MKLWIRALCVAAALVLGGGLAQAQVTSNISGVIDGSTEMPAVIITSSTCGTVGGFIVNYSAVPFRMTQTGAYDIEATAAAGSLSLDDLSFYLYEHAFDPGDGMLNCIAASNDDPAALAAFPLDSSVQYFLVTFDDTFGQATDTSPASYTVSLNGPGALVPAASPVRQVPIHPLPIGLLLVVSGAWALRRHRADMG
jgi:hypothetical protein